MDIVASPLSQRGSDGASSDSECEGQGQGDTNANPPPIKFVAWNGNWCMGYSKECNLSDLRNDTADRQAYRLFEVL